MKRLSSKEAQGIVTNVILANEVGAHVSIAAGIAIISGANKDRFMEACSRNWDAIAASVQTRIEEAIGEKGENV